MTDEIIDSRQWDDKMYMKYLPPHLREAYADGLRDATITHLNKQIALIDVRIKVLLQHLDQQVLSKDELAGDLRDEFPHLKKGDIADLADFIMLYLPEDFVDHRTFKQLDKIRERMNQAHTDGKIREEDRQRKLLFEAIERGRREGDVWVEVLEAMETRRRLVEAEERRRSNTQQTITLQQAVVLASLLIEACKESVMKYVSDREVQQLILRDTERSYAAQIGTGGNRQSD